MRDFNHVIIIGRLGRDPELKTNKNGTPYVDFSVANQRDFGENKSVNWIPCRAYKGLAETISKYLRKGSKVCFMGELKQDEWTAPSGEKTSRVYVLITDMQFMQKSDSETSPAPAPVQQQTRPAPVVPQSYESYEPYDYGSGYGDEF